MGVRVPWKMSSHLAGTGAVLPSSGFMVRWISPPAMHHFSLLGGIVKLRPFHEPATYLAPGRERVPMDRAVLIRLQVRKTAAARARCFADVVRRHPVLVSPGSPG